MGLLAQHANQVDRRGKVAVKGTPRKHRIGIPRAIKLELVYAIFADHLHTNIAEPGIILRSGECKTVVYNLIALLFAELDALFFRAIIPAPGRHPHAWFCAVLFRCCAHWRKSVGKAFVKAPQRGMIVPPIVKEIRIERDAALVMQFASERVDAVQRPGFVIGVEIAQIIPGVVMQECAVRMRALALNVIQKIAAQLAWTRHSDDRRIRNRLRRSEWKLAV